MQRFKYVKSIDGLRALSILAVMGFHGSGPMLLWFTGRAGWFGVNIFFVISGYLITSLLIDEQENLGRISLKKFYARRAIRIFPAYYFFLSVMCMVWVLAGVPQQISHALIAFAYLTDIDLFFNWGHSVATGLLHPWSLAMEEKFYLLYPLLLTFARSRYSAGTCALLVVALEVQKLIEIANHMQWTVPCGRFETSAESLLFGCLGGFVWAAFLKKPEWIKVVARPSVTVFLLVSAAIVMRTLGNASNWHSFTSEFIGWMVKMPALNLLVSALLVSLTFASKNNPISTLLSWSPLVWIGKLSYSLYLWHLFGYLFAGLVVKDLHVQQPVVAEVMNIGFSFVFALFSYFAIERPVLKLKSRFSKGNHEPPTGDKTVVHIATKPSDLASLS